MWAASISGPESNILGKVGIDLPRNQIIKFHLIWLAVMAETFKKLKIGKL